MLKPSSIEKNIPWDFFYGVLALRMYPGCEKVDSKVTAKTTLECLSDLIQSERDLSLFTKFLYSRYSIKDNQKVRFMMGQIGEVSFKRLVRTVMEETIGQWSQQSDLK